MSSCPICLETISSTKASPDVCDHLFCLLCLTKWSKMESFCPVDRKRFRKIINLDTGTSCEVKRRGKKRKAHTLYDVSAFCEVCRSEDKDDTLLLCDSCDLAYHCACLSPPLTAVPSGRWFCPVCNSIDKRLEQGEEISKKPMDEPCQSLIQTPSCSASTQSSLVVAKSSKDTSTVQPINRRNKINRAGNHFETVQSLSFPSTSSSGQLNAVKISQEDYQMLCTHSKSLFLAPGIRVSPNGRKIDKFTLKTKIASVVLPNESCKPSACDSSERSNSEVRSRVANMPEKKNADFDLKNKDINPNSSETSNIIYKSTINQLKGKESFMSKSNQMSSNLSTGCSYSDKNGNFSKCQSPDVSVLKSVLSTGKGKEKLESFEGILDDPKKVRDFSDSSECEIIFDGSNCITIYDNLSLKEFEPSPKISSVTSIAGQYSREISSENQSVALSRPASPNRGCLKVGNIAETIPDHVSETENEDDSPNHLNEFEICNTQYTYASSTLSKDGKVDTEANTNLPRELIRTGEEKGKLWTHKWAKPTTCTSQTKNQELEKTSVPDSKQVFNIIDYTRRVKKGKHLQESCEILNKYKAFVARNAKRSNSKPNIESCYDLNVFQGPFSQYSFVHGGTKMRFMHFNPSEIPKEDTITSNKFLKTYPAMLRRDFQDLSMREDGSLFLK